MFWRFGGYANISTIDTLLDKADVTLEQLLDESDLIQELKAHNTKLIEFLREETTLEKLLNYVIAPGPPLDDHSEEENDEPSTPEGKGKRRPISLQTGSSDEKIDEQEEKAEKQRLKYSYVACEVLSSETWSILEALMSNISHLTKFWEFLRRPPTLDPLQAGYFTKVNETLLDKKTEEMLEFFKSLEDIVPAMLQHVDCPMVMDLLLKIISLEKSEGGQGIVDWLQTQNLIPILFSSLAPECNSATQTSAGDFLKAIITISANAAQNEQSCIGPNSLTRQLVSAPCMESLISSMLQGGNPLTVGVGIVIEVIRKNNSDYDPENGHNPNSPPTSHDPIYLGTLLRLFARHVPDFMELILCSKHTVTENGVTKIVERGNLNSAWGTQIEPLGFDRFKTCELMAELLHCSNMALLNEKGSEDFIRQRDEERERLRSQGGFSVLKEADDSGVELSEDSSRFANGITSIPGTPQELRLTNSTEEDGFENVAIPDVPNAAEESGTGQVPPNGSASTSAQLADDVRRLRIDEPATSSPPNQITSETDRSLFPLSPKSRSPEIETSPISPHPEDKPAPLFSKSRDPNKTPTPMSPGGTASPKTSREESEDAVMISAHESEISINIEEEETLQTNAGDEEVVVGDYLKIMFVENKVVPTILSFFFRFPWNNFLHNVVYDVVQQVFNGPMERGFNRNLAIDLFETGNITDQIVEGQKRSDVEQQTKKMRLGYMGHLTLVAEEVVKFSERHPAELLSQAVMEKVLDRQWIEYVEQTLSQTRERDNAVLGGVRPDISLGSRQAVLNAVNANQGFANSAALANAGLNGGAGPQGLDSIDLSNNGSVTSGPFSTGSSSSFSGFGSSSDDEDEEMDDPEEEREAVPLSAADMGVNPDDVSDDLDIDFEDDGEEDEGLYMGEEDDYIAAWDEHFALS
jgi:SIT4-associating protein SAP185/190